MVIGTDCIGSCKYNYHTFTATTAPRSISEQNCIMHICMYHKQIYAYYIYSNGQLGVADYEEFETNYINMLSLDN